MHSYTKTSSSEKKRIADEKKAIDMAMGKYVDDFNKEQLEKVEDELAKLSSSEEEKLNELLDRRRRLSIDIRLQESKGKRKEWFLPFNLREHDIVSALKKFGIVDLEQGKEFASAKPGDSLYIYTDNGYESRIRYKGMILDVGKEEHIVSDSDYRRDGKKINGPCMEVAAFKEYTVNIDFGMLKVHGLKDVKVCQVRGNLKEFMRECDERQSYMRGTGEGGCLSEFPADIEDL